MSSQFLTNFLVFNHYTEKSNTNTYMLSTATRAPSLKLRKPTRDRRMRNCASVASRQPTSCTVSRGSIVVSIVTFFFVSMIVSNVIFNCSLKVWNVHSTGVWKEEKAHICTGVCYLSFLEPFCLHICICTCICICIITCICTGICTCICTCVRTCFWYLVYLDCSLGTFLRLYLYFVQIFCPLVLLEPFFQVKLILPQVRKPESCNSGRAILSLCKIVLARH